MSEKSSLRHDKTCLNCGHEVEERYCPHCGQENTDTRKTFHHLFIHFFEDLTHYENAFWKTIRHLLFKPGRLTKEYLSGKRLSYLAPVRLYIFISFVTFFIATVLTSPIEEQENPEQIVGKVPGGSVTFTETKDSINIITDSIEKQQRAIAKLVNDGILSKSQADTIKGFIRSSKNFQDSNFLGMECTSVRELDSVQKYGKPEDRMGDWQYWTYKKYINVVTKNTKKEIFEKFKESFMHNFPKVLFIYMPFFAFFLWLFHGKKRWYYFDHGIFTLHYFSFLLLMALINMVADWLLMHLGNVGDTISDIVSFIVFLWIVYYFFPAHHRFYEESRIISLIKSLALLFINFFLILFTMLAFAVWTLLNLH